MGAGTIASYAEPGDAVAYYEINPAVVDLGLSVLQLCPTPRSAARRWTSRWATRVFTLQGQLDAGQPQAFDVLVADAFSSDAIPVHLLTDECFALYEQHLAPGGILAFHVSNLFLDLAPVVRRISRSSTARRRCGAWPTATPRAPPRTPSGCWWLEPDVLRCRPCAGSPPPRPGLAHATQAAAVDRRLQQPVARAALISPASSARRPARATPSVPQNTSSATLLAAVGGNSSFSPSTTRVAVADERQLQAA